MTPAAFENALRVLLAIGGSTNGIVHLTAIAGRAGIDVARALQRADRPDAGAGRPQADRAALHGGPFEAGGLGAVLRELQRAPSRRAIVTGETLGERLAGEPDGRRSVVRPLAGADHRGRRAGRAVRHAGAGRRDHQALGRRSPPARARGPRGRVRVASRIWRRASTIPPRCHADDVLVLQNAGPKSGPGMPEAGYLPIPAKLARQASRTWSGSRMRA